MDNEVTASANRFRFRAYDKALGMCEVTAIEFGSDMLQVHFKDTFYNVKLKELVLMQSTGLLDKNGKEIFEGDLFKCIYHRYGHKDHIYSVMWNNLWANFGRQRHGPPCPQNEVLQDMRGVLGYSEVIGNIYENPELLQ